MKTWELVKDIQLKMPKLVKAMNESSHHFDETNLSSFHLEGSVWTHCQMVNLLASKENLSTRLAGFCHDFGKPISRTMAEETKRARFLNHEGISVFVALDYINTLSFLSKEEKVRITSLISLHTYLYTVMRTPGYEAELAKTFIGEVDLFKDLVSLTKADSLGRFFENEDRTIWENAENHFLPIINSISPETPLGKLKAKRLSLSVLLDLVRVRG